jgi:hypothetical protein
MPGRMSGSVPAALPGSGSCDFVPGSGSCDFVPGSGSCDFVPGSGSGCETYHYNLHMLPGRVSEA